MQFLILSALVNQSVGEKLAEMYGFDSYPMFYLLTAGGTTDYDSSARIVPYRREKDPLSNLHGDVVVFSLEPEGASHPAASCIQRFHIYTRNQP